MDYKALRDELDAGHPDTGPYSADDQTAADELNAVNRDINVDFVNGGALLAATDDVEYGAVTQDEKVRWLGVCAVNTVDVSSGVAKQEAKDIFGNQSQTWSNLLELKTVTISRAEELGFGEVREADVTEARTSKYD